MKKSEYLKKIVDRLEDSFVNSGKSDDYTIYWDVEKVNGVKHPILTLEFDDGHEKEFDLMDAYTRHEEEDVSMSDSFRSIKTTIYNYITAYENELENEDPFDQEEDEYDLEDEDSFNLDEDSSDELSEEQLADLRSDIRSHLRIKLLNVDDPSFDDLSGGILKLFGDIAVFPMINYDNDGLSLISQSEAFYLFDCLPEEVVNIAIESIQNNPDNIQCNPLGLDHNMVSISSAEGMFSESVMNRVKDLLDNKEFYIVPSSKTEIVAIARDALPIGAVLRSLRTSNEHEDLHSILSNLVYEYDFRNKIPRVALELTQEQIANHEEIMQSDPVQQVVRPSLDHSYQDNVNPVRQEAFEQPSDDASAQEDTFDQINHDEEVHDADYFADFDTYRPDEFANTMVELFNYRLGNNFHLDGMNLVDNDGTSWINLQEANDEYQANSMDFLEYGDFLTDRYTRLKEESLLNHDQQDENSIDLNETSEDYPDDYLPFF